MLKPDEYFITIPLFSTLLKTYRIYKVDEISIDKVALVYSFSIFLYEEILFMDIPPIRKMAFGKVAGHPSAR